MKCRASWVAMCCAVAGLARQVTQHGDPLGLAVLAIALPEHGLGAGLVHLGAKKEFPGRAARRMPEPAAPIDQPVMTLREARDVRLRVAALHAQRVQLQDLAREILIDAEAMLARVPLRARAASREFGPTEG